MTEQQLKHDVRAIFETQWEYRKGRVVPDSYSVRMLNDAVKIDAAVLFADLVGSTELVARGDRLFAAEVLKAYLHCASKLIKKCGGEITAYDGDRVMGMFIGVDREEMAIEAALRINSAVHNVINPLLDEQHTKEQYNIMHCIGVDAGPVVAVKTGVRGTNDLVWVGKCANYAAKLSSLRQPGVSIWATRRVFNALPEGLQHQDGRPAWSRYEWKEFDRPVWGCDLLWTGRGGGASPVVRALR